MSTLNGDSLKRSLFSISGMLRWKIPGAQLLEDLGEALAVEVTFVVLRVDDALVAVHHGERAVAGEPADQVRLEVEAGRLVEGLVDDDAYAAETRLRRAREMLAHAGCCVDGLTHIDGCPVRGIPAVEHVDDRPIAAVFAC
ncbi:hypothetical protein [Microbacterium lacticum]